MDLLVNLIMKYPYSGFLSGFGPRGGKTAICNLVGGAWLSQHAQQGGARVSLGGANAPPAPPPERNPDIPLVCVGFCSLIPTSFFFGEKYFLFLYVYVPRQVILL